MSNREVTNKMDLLSKRHITDDDLSAFAQDRMTMKEKEELLVHVCTCIYCADQFADVIAGDMVLAPKQMKQNLLEAVKNPKLQVQTQTKRISTQCKLILYSLKVGVAATSALLLLLLTVLTSDQGNLRNENNKIYAGFITNRPDVSSLREGLENVSEEIGNFSSNIFDFTNGIIKREVKMND